MSAFSYASSGVLLWSSILPIDEEISWSWCRYSIFQLMADECWLSAHSYVTFYHLISLVFSWTLIHWLCNISVIIQRLNGYLMAEERRINVHSFFILIFLYIYIFYYVSVSVSFLNPFPLLKERCFWHWYNYPPFKWITNYRRMLNRRPLLLIFSFLPSSSCCWH